MALKRINRKRLNEDKILTYLSADKLNTYRRFTKSDQLISSIQFFVITQQVSGFLFTPLQFLEISLRNIIYQTLSDFYTNCRYTPKGQDPQRWMYWLPQNSKVQHAVREADKNAHTDITHRPVVMGDVISRLTFGAWVRILNEQPNHKAPLHFWQYTAKDMFPNCPRRSQKNVLQRLRTINDIRNRLFHFEPIWNTRTCRSSSQVVSDMRRKYEMISETIQWISKDIDTLLELFGHKEFMDNILNRFMQELPAAFN